MKYYGLISGLPVPKSGQGLTFSIPDLRSQVEPYLQDAHLAAFRHFFYRIDLANLEAMMLQHDRFKAGGNLDQEQLRRLWHREAGATWSLSDPDEPEAETPVERLHGFWQRYYDQLIAYDADQLQRLFSYEISLKNFSAGFLRTALQEPEEPHYLEGGRFDRFAYNKLQVADIQAEHPAMAATLNSLTLPDPDQRERSLTETKWTYYDHVVFFDPFGLQGLFALMLRYLDMAAWQERDANLGAQQLSAFSEQIRQRIETSFTVSSLA
ncbi:MAG: DUF2764 family protein [Bacteroidetes bacterium]|nr:DUF2764 family protein [Bacteroidota bacterium]